MQIGYARVSTDDQDTAAQVSALKSAGCERICREKASGGRWERPELQRLLDLLRVDVKWFSKHVSSRWRNLVMRFCMKAMAVAIAISICMMPRHLRASNLAQVSALSSKCQSGKQSACNDLAKIAEKDKDATVRSAASALLPCSDAECGPFPKNYESIVREWERNSGWVTGIPIVSISVPVRGVKGVPGWKSVIVKRGNSTASLSDGGYTTRSTISGTFSREITIYDEKVVKVE